MNEMVTKSGDFRSHNTVSGSDGWSPDVLQTVKVVEGSQLVGSSHGPNAVADCKDVFSSLCAARYGH